MFMGKSWLIILHKAFFPCGGWHCKYPEKFPWFWPNEIEYFTHLDLSRNKGNFLSSATFWGFGSFFVRSPLELEQIIWHQPTQCIFQGQTPSNWPQMSILWSPKNGSHVHDPWPYPVYLFFRHDNPWQFHVFSCPCLKERQYGTQLIGETHAAGAARPESNMVSQLQKATSEKTRPLFVFRKKRVAGVTYNKKCPSFLFAKKKLNRYSNSLPFCWDGIFLIPPISAIPKKNSSSFATSGPRNRLDASQTSSQNSLKRC